jgi:hypothetical protein
LSWGRLEAIGAKHSKIKLRARPRDINFAPGTVLLREWGERPAGRTKKKSQPIRVGISHYGGAGGN